MQIYVRHIMQRLGAMHSSRSGRRNKLKSVNRYSLLNVKRGAYASPSPACRTNLNDEWSQQEARSKSEMTMMTMADDR